MTNVEELAKAINPPAISIISAALSIPHIEEEQRRIKGYMKEKDIGREDFKRLYNRYQDADNLRRTALKLIGIEDPLYDPPGLDK